MCSAIGVDPLVGASARKRDAWTVGWGVLGVGEFWIGVATRVVDICRKTREQNGGFISVVEVKEILNRQDQLSGANARGIKEIVEISEYYPFGCY